MKPINRDPNLLKAIDTLLSDAPEGLREMELIDQLDREYPKIFPKPDLSDTWLLFQHHFVLRHHIYALQESLWASKAAQLQVDPVRIVKTVYIETEATSVGEADSVRDFYLDFSNLFEENEASVEAMLAEFWVSLARYQMKPEALKVLGLTGEESHSEQKKRYKQLVQKHHPDKGGDADVFNQIQTAWEQLTQTPGTKKPLN